MPRRNRPDGVHQRKRHAGKSSVMDDERLAWEAAERELERGDYEDVLHGRTRLVIEVSDKRWKGRRAA